MNRREVFHGTALVASVFWLPETVWGEGNQMSDIHAHSLATGLTTEDVQSVSPALLHYTQDVVMDRLWKRLELSPRDRGLITAAALIARMQTLAMPHYFGLALDHGVKPAELSETILHLAFYTGFPNAIASIDAAKQVFVKRGVNTKELPAVREKLLPLNEEAESQRATQVSKNFGSVSPGLRILRLLAFASITGDNVGTR